MNQEQFKSIRIDLNRLFDIINHTKFLGRDKLVSKFEKYDRRIKNIIDIPKVKSFDDVIDYKTQQLLLSDTFRWESSSSDVVMMHLNLELNFIEDRYAIKVIVDNNSNKYSPAFEINPSEDNLFAEVIETNRLTNFVIKLRDIYSNLMDIKYFNNLLIDSKDVDDFNALVNTIIDKLEE